MSAEEHVREPRVSHTPKPASTTSRRASETDAAVVRLQRTLGNRAIGRLVESSSIGVGPAVVQRQEDEDEETSTAIQRQTEAEPEPAAAIVQRLAEDEEEPAPAIQRQTRADGRGAAILQRRTEAQAEPAAAIVQRLAEDEEEPATAIQRELRARTAREAMVQRQHEDEEDTAPALQRQTSAEGRGAAILQRQAQVESAPALQRRQGANDRSAAIVQRQDDEEEAGAIGSQQSQVLSTATLPNFERDAAQLERAAAEAATRLQLLIEDEQGAETRGERLTIDSLRQSLVATFGGIRSRSREITAAIQRQPGEQQAVERALATIGEIDAAFTREHEKFRARLAANIHRTELTTLATPSSPRELSAVGAGSRARAPSVTPADIREIQNWVGGGWSTMNRFMFGIESAEDRGARQAVLDQPLPPAGLARDLVAKNQWEMNLQARVNGLEAALTKLPRYTGSTYRQATPKDMTVYGGTIKVGDFIQSPGFFATSMVRGGGGAAGGSTWGHVPGKAYFQVTGTSGRDLGPYQETLATEREVLYPANAVFEVKAIAERNGAVFVIVSQVLVVPEGATVREPYAGALVRPPYAEMRDEPAEELDLL